MASLSRSVSALFFVFCATVISLWLPGRLRADRISASLEIRHGDSFYVSAAWFAHGRTLTSLESGHEVERMPLLADVSSDPVSPLDVSEAGLVALQGTLPKLYHSPEVFSLSYNEMRTRMQIWIYPAQEGSHSKYEHKRDGGEGGDESEELSSTADLFFRLLSGSEFVTEDPKHAQLFLLPVSMDALWVDLGPSRIAEQIRRYVQSVRDSYPYWDLSLGADHFYLSCHAFAHNSRHRNMLEFGKNAIQAACAPLRHKQHFYPHKDMVFPPYKPVMDDDIRAALVGRTNRSSLAYFPGSLDVTPALVSVIETWKSDPEFEVEADPPPHRSSVYRNLARSRFCVSLPPHDTVSVVDALRFGCVPVLVSKSVFHDLPFQGFLNWREFAVVLGLEDLLNLKSILTSISPGKYQQMQYLGHQASKHLEWNNPPVPYDAFHMTLVELWVRRHSIKYARRSKAASS